MLVLNVSLEPHTYSQGSWLTREAIEVNGSEKFEEFDAVLWVIREIFINHLQGTLKHILHDNWDFVFH